jgi:hypothetical protein
MRVCGHVLWPIDRSEPVVYVVSGGCPPATWLANVSARSLPRELLCDLIFPRCVRMCCFAADFEGACDREECVAVDVVFVGGWAV